MRDYDNEGECSLKEREDRVARQKTRLEKLERGGHWDLANDARQVLTLLEDALRKAA